METKIKPAGKIDTDDVLMLDIHGINRPARLPVLSNRMIFIRGEKPMMRIEVMFPYVGDTYKTETLVVPTETELQVWSGVCPIEVIDGE